MSEYLPDTGTFSTSYDDDPSPSLSPLNANYRRSPRLINTPNYEESSIELAQSNEIILNLSSSNDLFPLPESIETLEQSSQTSSRLIQSRILAFETARSHGVPEKQEVRRRTFSWNYIARAPHPDNQLDLFVCTLVQEVFLQI